MGRAPHLSPLALESDTDHTIATEAMTRTGVLPFATRAVQQLSGGERQRVMLARALAQDTPILLLDEPAAFLDIRYEVEMFALLATLAQEGKSLLTVVHNINTAAQYCDRILLLKQGRVVAVGPPATVLTSALLTQVYDTSIRVERDSNTGTIFVAPCQHKP
mgnify:CR=1 FL=1